MGDDAREKGDGEELPADEAALSARFKRLGERLGRVHADRPSESSSDQRPAADPSAIARGFRLSTEFVAGVVDVMRAAGVVASNTLDPPGSKQ